MLLWLMNLGFAGGGAVATTTPPSGGMISVRPLRRKPSDDEKERELEDFLILALMLEEL